jgi:hypothetical protein
MGGGENEKDIVSATGVKIARVHSNGGEVHFHDSTNNRKVAVSIAEFMKRFPDWQKNSSTPLVFTDKGRQTSVKLEMEFTNGEMEVKCEFSALKIGPNLKALSDFADGK